jgi:cation-transporting ATPase E
MLVAILGLWVLILVSLPLTWAKRLIVAAMIVGYLLISWLPITAWFFQLEPLSTELLVLVAVVAVAGSALIGIAFMLQRVWLRRTEAQPRLRRAVHVR